jgi:hypothetical protein
MLAIEKVLSENDLGLTNSHQAGFLIPKALVRQGLFESLSETNLNPRKRLKITESDTGTEWHFTYIFYNNKFFGGSRSEYRLTGLASFLREHSLRPGDSIVFTRVEEYDYKIEIKRKARKSSILTQDSWISIYGENN